MMLREVSVAAARYFPPLLGDGRSDKTENDTCSSKHPVPAAEISVYTW